MIRFGMALMEMVEQLTKGFIKATGRQPDILEKLKIQQDAVQRFKKEGLKEDKIKVPKNRKFRD